MNISTINTSALNTTVQSAVQPMFWGAVAMIALAPIAGAAGSFVASKIDKNYDSKKKSYA